MSGETAAAQVARRWPSAGPQAPRGRVREVAFGLAVWALPDRPEAVREAIKGSYNISCQPARQ